MDYSLPGSLRPWDFPGKNTGVGCHFLLQGIFLTQGSTPGLPRCSLTRTAGTTVQNILFRFAERHDLMVPLPHPSCEHQFCHPRNFLAHFMHAATRPLHVLASHQRLDRGAAAPHAARHRLRHHPARAGRHVQVALQRLQPVLQERH